MPQKVIVFPAARLKRFVEFRADGSEQEDNRFNVEIDDGRVCKMLGDILTGTPAVERAGVTSPARRAAFSHDFDQRFLDALQARFANIGVFDSIEAVTPAWRE